MRSRTGKKWERRTEVKREKQDLAYSIAGLWTVS